MSKKVERKGKLVLLDIISALYGVDPTPVDEILSHNVRKILVIRQHDQMGDMLLAVPALRGIKRRFPDAVLDVVASSVNAVVLHGNPFVRKVYEIGRMGRGKGKYGFLKLIRELRAERYDLAVVLNTVSFSVTSMLIAVVGGARYRVGCTGVPFGYKHTSRLYHVELPLPDRDKIEGMNESEHNLFPLSVLGVEEKDLSSIFVPTSADEEAADGFVRAVFGSGGSFAVVHPGAGKVPNRWPAERFAEVSKMLKERLGIGVVAVAGPMDDEPFERFLRSIGSCPAVVHSPSIGFLAALMKRAALVLCNDTGVMHVAGAVRAKTVAIFGPTPPSRWKPSVDEVVALRGQDGRVESVSVEEVFRSALGLLGVSHGNEGDV